MIFKKKAVHYQSCELLLTMFGYMYQWYTEQYLQESFLDQFTLPCTQKWLEINNINNTYISTSLCSI